MFKQFTRMTERWEELNTAIAQPEVIMDTAKYQAYLKERSQLEEPVAAWHRYLKLQQHLQEASEILEDPEMAEEAQAEIDMLRQQIDSTEQQLRILLLPRDPDEGRSLFLEIRPGAGGEEACLFGADMLRLYIHYAARRGWKSEIISMTDTELGGIKEAVLLVSGPDAFARLKYESGVHRVQRVPVTDSTGKKQTSTCTVAIMPEAEEKELHIDPDDLRIDVYRSTGHGGQCINTTDSAVRITHLPTGTVVTCQDQKSQLKNRDQAMRVLRARLKEKLRNEQQQESAAARRLQVGTGDRSERIRTYNFHESRVTDHRIGLTVYRIDDVMNGDLDEFVDTLLAGEQEARLKALSAQ